MLKSILDFRIDFTLRDPDIILAQKTHVQPSKYASCFPQCETKQMLKGVGSLFGVL